MTDELWKDIEEWEGKYAVSTHGRVKSKAHYSANNHLISERIMKLSRNHGRNNKPIGALKVMLQYGETKKAYAVSRLVYEAFCGHIKRGECIRHADKDNTNNHVANLFCVPHMRGEFSVTSKFTPQQIASLRQQYLSGSSIYALARDNNVAWTTIRAIVRKRSYAKP
jgi:hypothetical protein